MVLSSLRGQFRVGRTDHSGSFATIRNALHLSEKDWMVLRGIVHNGPLVTHLHIVTMTLDASVHNLTEFETGGVWPALAMHLHGILRRQPTAW